MFAGLNARQLNEILIYSHIEPISWDMGVSQPAEPDEKLEDVENKLDSFFSTYEKQKKSK